MFVLFLFSVWSSFVWNCLIVCFFVCLFACLLACLFVHNPPVSQTKIYLFWCLLGVSQRFPVCASCDPVSKCSKLVKKRPWRTNLALKWWSDSCRSLNSSREYEMKILVVETIHSFRLPPEANIHAANFWWIKSCTIWEIWKSTLLGTITSPFTKVCLSRWFSDLVGSHGTLVPHGGYHDDGGCIGLGASNPQCPRTVPNLVIRTCSLGHPATKPKKNKLGRPGSKVSEGKTSLLVGSAETDDYIRFPLHHGPHLLKLLPDWKVMIVYSIRFTFTLYRDQTVAKYRHTWISSKKWLEVISDIRAFFEHDDMLRSSIYERFRIFHTHS